jgi:hypothetical protein
MRALFVSAPLHVALVEELYLDVNFCAIVKFRFNIKYARLVADEIGGKGLVFQNRDRGDFSVTVAIKNRVKKV